LPSMTYDENEATETPKWVSKFKELEAHFFNQMVDITKNRKRAMLPKVFPTQPSDEIRTAMDSFIEYFEGETRSGCNIQLSNPQSSVSRKMESYWFTPVVVNNVRKVIRSRREEREASPLEGFKACFSNTLEEFTIHMVVDSVMTSEEYGIGDDELSEEESFQGSHLTPLAEQLQESLAAAKSVIKEMNYMERRESRMRLTADSINARSIPSMKKSDRKKGDQNSPQPQPFLTSLDVESLVVDPVADGASVLTEIHGDGSPVKDAISNADAAARKMLSDAKKAFNFSNSLEKAERRNNRRLSNVAEEQQGDSGGAKEDSNLWSSAGDSASAAVESLLLNPIHEVAAFADDYVVAPTGEAILKSGEVISHMTSLLHSREDKPTDSTQEAPESDRKHAKGGTTQGPPSIKASQDAPKATDPPIIDIHSPRDVDEVELIARPTDDEEEYDTFGANPDSLLLHQQQLGTEEQIMTSMNVRLIRGKDLPFDNTRLRISVLNDAGRIDQILGNTAWTNTDRNPIWGTKRCSWSIMGQSSTYFIFALEESENELDDEAEKKEERDKEDRKTRILAKVAARDLMTSKKNPNLWIKLTDYGSTKISDCGFIRLRLSQPRRAVLHQQENCPRITPGPAFPRMESYAIRKKVMYSHSPVILNVYDVSNDSRVEAINNTVKSFGYGGIFHAAIEIHGKEYSFGGTRDRHSRISGVFSAPPKQCPMHHYRESIYLGDCELSQQETNYILDDMRPKWMAVSYNLFRKNCAFFSREFAIELGVGDFPEWVFSLATTTEFIEPYMIQLNAYLTNRTKAQHPPAPPTKLRPKQQNHRGNRRTILTKEASQVLAVALEEDGSMRAQQPTSSAQDALFDHAMAARIQRSFRAASFGKLPVAKGKNRT
ncbi:MAG: hypothetical protein SGILL_007971, partial [Bacillariaceae sp.]